MMAASRVQGMLLGAPSADVQKNPASALFVSKQAAAHTQPAPIDTAEIHIMFGAGVKPRLQFHTDGGPVQLVDQIQKFSFRQDHRAGGEQCLGRRIEMEPAVTIMPISQIGRGGGPGKIGICGCSLSHPMSWRTIARAGTPPRLDPAQGGAPEQRLAFREQSRSCHESLSLSWPGSKSVEERAKPQLAAADDAIVKVTRTTICGTDLHILKGDVPTCTPGRILGHEGVGIVESIGTGITRFKPGDRVLISCVTACGKCDYCRRGMYSHCETGGWISGTPSTAPRRNMCAYPMPIPASTPLPKGMDEEALVMLSDVLPTAFECGVLNGKMEDPGISVAIVGAGAIGLATLLTAQFFSPGKIIVIDRDDNRLEQAKRLGASDTIDNSSGDLLPG